MCLSPARERLPREKRVQAKFADQFQRQPRAAELPAILDTHPRGVDGHPLGLGLLDKRVLPFRRTSYGRIAQTETSRFIQLAQPGDHALPRSTLGTIGFDERPIGMAFSILVAEAGSNEHAPHRIAVVDDAKSKVFTTRRFRNPNAQHRPSSNDLHSNTAQKNHKIVDSSTALGKLG